MTEAGSLVNERVLRLSAVLLGQIRRCCQGTAARLFRGLLRAVRRDERKPIFSFVHQLFVSETCPFGSDRTGSGSVLN